MQLHYRGIAYSHSLSAAAPAVLGADQPVTMRYRGVAYTAPSQAIPAESPMDNPAVVMQYRGVPMTGSSRLSAWNLHGVRLCYRGIPYAAV